MGRELKRFDTAEEAIDFVVENGKEIEDSVINKNNDGYSRYYVEIIDGKITDAWIETYSSYLSVISFLK
ncbi:hypothetical protein [Clostridium thailandense]|uniref:hypothetical protein n=1 Tax=Clostridium thailandense TaxID=2794346 RepID=UPI003988BAFC